MKTIIINKQGLELYACDECHGFFRGLCAVKNNGKWGQIDSNGKVVIPLQYDGIGRFEDGLCAVKIKDKWGFIDKTNTLVIKAIYENVCGFKDKCCQVMKNGKWGLINTRGELLFPYIKGDADYVSTPHDGLILMYEEKKMMDGQITESYYWFIDVNGNVKIPKIKSNYISDFSEGLSIISISDNSKRKEGYIDKTGNILIPCQFDSANSFHEGLAIVAKKIGENNKYGVINKEGKLIVPFLYDSMDDYENGFARVSIKSNNKWMNGLIDTNGKEVIPCCFEGDRNEYSSYSFSENIGYGKSNDTLTFFNNKGENIFSIKAEFAGRFHGGLCSININNKYGFIDTTGKIVIPCIYDFAGSFSNGLCLVILDGKGMIINKSGDIAFSLPKGNYCYQNKASLFSPVKFPIVVQDVVGAPFYEKDILIDASGRTLFKAHTIEEGFQKGEDILYSVRVYDMKKLISRCGYIDQQGKVVIPCKYIEAETFDNNGFAEVKSDVVNIAKQYRTSARKTTQSATQHSYKKSQNNEGCYIATAIYGSYDCPEVWILRRFRDEILYKKIIGRIFIKIYYVCSPVLVKHCGHIISFQSFWKKRLDKLVAQLKSQGFEESFYQDKSFLSTKNCGR